MLFHSSRWRHMHLLTRIAAVLVLCIASVGIVQAQTSISVLDDKVKKYVNDYGTEDGSWTVNGRIIEGRSIRTSNGIVDFQADVRGYSGFTADVGVPDDEGDESYVASVSVKLNDEEVQQFTQRKGNNVRHIDLAFSGRDTLRVTIPQGYHAARVLTQRFTKMRHNRLLPPRSTSRYKRILIIWRWPCMPGWTQIRNLRRA